MELHLLLDTLANQSVKLAAQDNSLEINAPKGAITPELRHWLGHYKSEILALLQQKQEQTRLPVIVPQPQLRYEPFPLTDMQYAFWVGRSGVLELGDVANHGYYEIEGQDLDLDRLNWALQQLIQRHDMLRAIVLPDGQQQVLSEVPPYQMSMVDLRGMDAATATSKLKAIRDRLSHQVVPADRWPLFEFSATRLDGGRVRLHISYDLQVFDAWSLFRLFDEWFLLYQNPQASLPALELSFRDYVLALQGLQETEWFARSQNYWLSRLDSLPPAPDLPLAKTPQELQHHRTQRYEAKLESAVWAQLKQRASQAGLTPSGVLLAAFAEILTLWGKNPQFTINLALFNRLPLHPQVNDLLGDFTSVTLLAVDNSQAEPFQQRAIRLQQQLWRDLEHRHFSGVRVVRELARRRGSAPSAMPIVFTSTIGFNSLGQETLTFSHFGEMVYGISQASQAWMDIQVWEEKGTLTFNWDVVAELFPEGLIEAMFSAYHRLLQQLATSELVWTNPSRQLLPPDRLAQREAANATDAPISDALLQVLFAQQVALQPQHRAVVSAQRTLTYQQLYDLAQQVGHRLRRLGVAPNHPVAVVMEKGWEQVVAVFGILTAGGAYVPIDPSLPRDRLYYLLENSNAQIILTQTHLKDSLEVPPGVTRLCVEDCTSESTTPLSPIQTPDDLAYIIYTSGSTGLPKGVMITHRNVANLVVYTNQRFQVGCQDAILGVTALNHDLSVYDIFGLLSAGGTLVLPDASRVKDPKHWAEWLQREPITLWNSVPPMMEMLVEGAEASLPHLRLAILGGDWLPVSLPNRIQALAPNVQVLSIGGPTETTVWNIGYLVTAVDPSWKSIPYGKPMANSKYYILNSALEDCPVWVPGEMYCAGVQVAKGYWRNPEKTQASFITHPRTGERLYRTGDMGRYLPDGNIEFLGRADFQIKIRGYRIEAGEVEAALLQHPAVRAAVVMAMGESSSQARLVAYLIPQAKSLLNLAELSDFLKQKLPDYMIPSGFSVLESFPLSANGKIDRRRLAQQNAEVQKLEACYVAPKSDLERQVVEAVQAALGIEKVGINDNFFDLGGNSLLLTKIYRKLSELLPNRVQYLTLMDLFKYPTTRALVQYLSADSSFSALEPSSGREQQILQGKSRLQKRFAQSRISKQ
ncbi:MAG: amino acid adenylation domain-containing protein [Desertifilum sp.]|nr:amino acid adenylation domain-containing protein [Desertifilum sp.]